jgi:hypothetical protein
MTHPGQKCGCRDRCLLELLLGLLQAQSALPWPGADGLTLEEVLDEYPRAAREGRVPNPDDLCRCFPHLATEIRFATREGTAAAFLARCRCCHER